MYALLFAGGVGQRLWPISRKNSPKQFSPILHGKSSVELAVERLLLVMPPENIYISTNKNYLDVVSKQNPMIPIENIILEPERRDLGAAAALAFYTMQKQGVSGCLMFQWADNYLQNEKELLRAIEAGERLIEDDANRIVFLGQVPRMATDNLGYIEHGEQIGVSSGVPYYTFKSWHYRPPLATAKQMVQAGTYLWNSGYFITSLEFLIKEYEVLAPEITSIAQEIMQYADTEVEEEKAAELYSKMPKIHFDESFLMRISPEKAIMMKYHLGWTDPGSLTGLKEALQKVEMETVTQGKVVHVDTTDSLLVNERKDLVLATMGLQGVIVVCTEDTILVIDEHSVRYIKNLLSELESEGYSYLL